MGTIYSCHNYGKKIFLYLLFARLLQTFLKFLGAFPLPSETSTLLSVKSLHEIQ